ncbi:hypothetical protein [uncultured Microbacterium sp.]|uniref:phage tail tube protein n=1 Tax=uncultured Microbacterium sp. TaxID=191216 RepID=UPI002610AB0B|nr:hypothetical protein [uncultured Microbacterium sp.]
MPDVADVTPPALDVKGNTVIWWVATIADLLAPKAATEIGAVTSFRVTHSFTPSGFALDGDQAVDVDSRLALEVDLESLGTRTDTLGMLEYVDSSAATSASVVLKPVSPATTKSGFFVIRRNVSNKTLAAAAQKVLVVPVTLGSQIFPVNPDGKFRIKQRASITGPIVEGVLAT